MKITRKKLLIVIFILAITIVTIASLIFGHLFYGAFIGESNDDSLLGYVHEVSTKLSHYKDLHKTYPISLKEASIPDSYCVFTECFYLKYNTSKDRNNYYLAANANAPFIVFATSDYSSDNNCNCSFGLVENYNGTRKDIPIYRKDKSLFPNPNLWPKLDYQFDLLQNLE